MAQRKIVIRLGIGLLAGLFAMVVGAGSASAEEDDIACTGEVGFSLTGGANAGLTCFVVPLVNRGTSITFSVEEDS